MGLETFLEGAKKALAPVRALDEQLLKSYTAVTKKWEDKGHDRISLALPASLLGFGTSFIGMLTFYNIPQTYWAFAAAYLKPVNPLLILTQLDFTLTGGCVLEDNAAKRGVPTFHDREEFFTGRRQAGDKFIINDPFIFFAHKLSTLTRTPAFLAGQIMLVKGGVDLLHYVANSSQTLEAGVSNLLAAAALLGYSSSVFIKHSNPKIIDRQTTLENTYERVKGTVASLLPKRLRPEANPVLYN